LIRAPSKVAIKEGFGIYNSRGKMVAWFADKKSAAVWSNLDINKRKAPRWTTVPLASVKGAR
jgi:hypothetical protein